jgi:hypothetical protein
MKDYKVLSRKATITCGDYGIWKKGRGGYPNPLIWEPGTWYGYKVGDILKIGSLKEVRRPLKSGIVNGKPKRSRARRAR